MHINIADALVKSFLITSIVFKIDIRVDINNKAINKHFSEPSTTFSSEGLARLGQPFMVNNVPLFDQQWRQTHHQHGRLRDQHREMAEIDNINRETFVDIDHIVNKQKADEHIKQSDFNNEFIKEKKKTTSITSLLVIFVRWCCSTRSGQQPTYG